MKKIILIIFLFSASCSQENAVINCTLKQENMIVEYKYTAKKDQLLSTNMKQEYPLDLLNMSEQEFEEMITEVKKQYNINGVNYEVELKENLVKEDITIDYKKAKEEDLIKIGFSGANKDGKKLKYDSLNVNLTNIQASGAICEN